MQQTILEIIHNITLQIVHNITVQYSKILVSLAVYLLMINEVNAVV